MLTGETSNKQLECDFYRLFIYFFFVLRYGLKPALAPSSQDVQMVTVRDASWWLRDVENESALEATRFAEKALIVSILILLLLAIAQHIWWNGHAFNR